MELLKENDSKLLEVSTEWDFEVDGDPSDVVKEMVEIMSKNGGIGLAAPQCGLLKRIFIMGNSTKLVACINPKIVSVSNDTQSDLEGCLSFPELFMKVNRPVSCVVEYQTVNKVLVTRELTGLEARVYLHEYDHLLGITFDQRVGDLSLKMAKQKRVKQAKKLSKASSLRV